MKFRSSQSSLPGQWSSACKLRLGRVKRGWGGWNGCSGGATSQTWSKPSSVDDTTIQFAYQTEQLGTGHAVMMCREQLANHNGPVVVVAGDSPMMQASSIKSLLDEFEQSKPACILGTLIHEDPTGLGRIVRDADEKIYRDR